jgi:uncharacterized protein YbjT (DUF2867 family)
MIGIVPYQCGSRAAERRLDMLLITGATGNVGAELVRALIDAGEQVRALTRADRADGLPAGAEAVTGDLNRPDSLSEALAGVRGVFLLPGYEDMDGVLAALRDAGVERVVLLSGSSAATGDTSNAVTAYMMRSEAAVKQSGVPWTILRPFGFMSSALRWRDQLRD